MKNFNKQLIEALMSLVGVIFLALGLATIVKAAIGLDPWGVLFFGVLSAYNKVTPLELHFIQYGDMITIVSTIFVLIASLMKKERIKWLSIVSGFFLGQFVNIWVALWFSIQIPSVFIGSFNVMSLLILAFGIFTLSLGSTISLNFPMLMTPVDYLILAIKDYFPNREYGPVRIMADTSAVIVGYIITFIFTQNFFTASIGIGTILMFFCVGFVINLLIPFITPITNKIKNSYATN